jgi:hypothetical protein
MDTINLLDYKDNNWSQFGEDGILAQLFNIIGMENKWCLEVGAGDGKYLSNTYNLAMEHWTRILIERDKMPTKWFDNDITIHAEVKVISSYGIDFHLWNHDAPQDIDFVCIDIDGNDYRIWDAMSWRPRVVMIEYNPSFAFDVEYIQKLDENIGSSLLSLVLLGVHKGYKLVCCNEVNAIFVREDLLYNLDLQCASYIQLYHLGNGERLLVAKDYDGNCYNFGRWELSGSILLSQDLLASKARKFNLVDINKVLRL